MPLIRVDIPCPDLVPTLVGALDNEPDRERFAAWMHANRHVVLGLDSETNAKDPWDLAFLCRAVQISDGRVAWMIDVQGSPRPWLAQVLHDHPKFVAHFSEAETRFMGRGIPGSVRLFETEPHILDHQVPQAIVYPRTLLPRKDGVDSRLIEPKGLKESYARIFSPCLKEAEEALHRWFKENAPKGHKTKEASLVWGFANIPFMTPEYVVYSTMDAVAVKRMWDHTIAIAKQRGLMWEVEFELENQWDIDNMTYRGWPVDAPYVAWLRDELDRVIAAETWSLAQWGIKPSGMGDRVSEALLEEGAPVLAWTKGSEKSPPKPQWNREVLTKIEADETLPSGARALAGHLLTARRAGKFRTNYIQPMLDALERDGRVRCSFRSIGTVTHRNSAANPPLQQLPKKDARVRAAFGGLPGYVVVTCDLAQGEPRVMAGLSGDPNYVAAVNSGDVNNVAAAAAFGEAFNPAEGKTAGTPSYIMRQGTKAGFLAVCYAVGDEKLATTMGLPVGLAREKKANWQSEYAVMFGRGARMNKQEYVRLPSGRSIILWDRKIVMDDGRILTSSRPSRKALNYETQGHQADILKACWRKLRRKWGWALIFLLHDEIVLLVPEAMAEEARRDLQEAMTLYIGHGVTMLCEATIEGPTWIKQPETFDRRELESVEI